MAYVTEKSKFLKEAPLTNPNQGGGKQSKEEATVYVHGAVEAHPPESLLKQHTAERKEDAATHISERNEDRRAEFRKLLLELGALVAVIVYAGIAFWQGCLMKQSVQVTQENFIKEQRAWISVVVPNFFPLDGPTIPVKIQIVDTGKTVAKNVNGDFIATVLNRGEVPGFDQYGEGHPHNKLYAGGLHPNAAPPLDATLTVVRYGPQIPEVIVPTQELREKIASGNSYIIFFGEITYCDVFHVKHWTKFCNGSGKALEASGVKECIAYNDVDTNITPGADCP